MINTSMTFPLVALAIALAISLALTPLMRRVATAVGLIDHPDNYRKHHREPIALCGGPVVLLSLLGSVAFALIVFPELTSVFQMRMLQAVSLGVGAIGIVLLGVLDDRFGLRGRQKLAGQTLICLSIIAFGFSMNSIHCCGVTVDLGLLAIPVALGWLLLCINSVNLIDGADGLCSSVGWISAAAISAISWFTNNHMEAMVAGALAGALLGFLFFNLPPAKVFLGDAGSMLIGLILGVLAMRNWNAEGSAIAISIPVVLMAIPLFDSAMAILRRKLTGRSVFTVDRGHLHHHLIRHGFKNRKLVAVITVLSLITASGAVFGVVFHSDLISLGTIVFALGSLIVSRLFGFAEMELLVKRVFNFLRSLVARRGKSDDKVRQQVVQLQGSRNWETVWNTLVEFADKHDLAQVSLDLNMPWLHEGFHANWHRNRMPEYSERWNLRLPVISDGTVLGRIDIVGHHRGEQSYSIIAQLSELLESMQHDFQSVIDDFTAAHSAPVASRKARGMPASAPFESNSASSSTSTAVVSSGLLR